MMAQGSKMPRLLPAHETVSYSGPSTSTALPRSGPVRSTWPSTALAQAMSQPSAQPSATPCVKSALNLSEAILRRVRTCLP